MPPILVYPTSTVTDGTSLGDYREAIARKLGPFWRGTVSSEATGLEADRYVICDGFRSDVVPAGRFDGLYLYVRSGDQAGTQRMVVPGGLDGPIGAVAADYPFAAPLTETTQVELAVLPAIDYLGMPGLNPIVNAALRGQWLRDRLAFTGDGGYSYGLGTYPWLRTTDQLVGLVDSLGVPVGGNPTTAATPWRIRYNGDTRYLETDLAYADGDAFEVEVYRPAHTLVRVAGAWGSGDGLTDDTDEAVPPAYVVTTIGMALAYQELLGRAEWDDRLKPSRERFEREYRRWGRAAVRLKWEALNHEAEPYPLVSGQGSGSGWGNRGLWGPI